MRGLIAALVLCCAAASSMAADPSTPARLVAVVTDDRGALLADASATLEKQDRAPVRGVSDERGAVEVRAAAGRYRLVFERAGSCRLAHGDVTLAAGQALELRVALQPCAAVAGVVRQPGGEPVAGARVRVDLARQRPPALRAGSEDEGDLRGGRVEVETGPDGGFRLAQVPRADGYLLEVRHPDFPALARRLDVRADGARVTLVLQPGAEVRGTFVGDDDKPLGDVEIVAVRLDADEPREEVRRAASGPDGAFRLRPLPPGRFRVEIHPPAGLAQFRGPFTLAAGQAWDLGRIRVRPGVAITGRVFDGERKPVAKAKVVALRQLGGATKKERVATTSEAGAFRLAGLAEGAYTLRVEPPDTHLRAAREDVPAPSHDVELKIARAASLTGEVRARGGRCTLERLRLLALDVSRPEHPREVGTAEILDPDRGTFRVTRLPAGDIAVRAVASGCRPVRAAPTHLEEGGAAGPIEVVLQAGALLEGRVVDARTGSGVAAAVVTLEENASDTVATGEDGRFELTGARPGQNVLRVRHPDYAPARFAAALDLDDPQPAQVALAPGGTVQGSVRLATGAPVPGARIEVNASEATGDGSPLTTVTGDDGTFRFDHVPAGPVDVRRVGGGDPFEEADGKGVDLVDGAVAQVDFTIGGVVEGRVTRGGLPVAGARVTFGFADWTTRDMVVRSAWTDPDGAYRAEGIAPGETAILISAEGQESVRHASLPNASPHRLDIALGSRALAGIVVEGRTARGIPAIVGANPQDQETGFAHSSATGIQDEDGQVFLLRLGGADSEEARTEADGTFRVWIDPGRAYRVYADGIAGGAGSATLAADQDGPVRVELVRQATLHVRVLGPAGEAVSGVRVCSRVHRDPRGEGPQFSTMCTSTGDGESVTDVPFQWGAGDKPTVLAVAAGLAARREEVPELRADGDGEPNTITLQLERGGAAQIWTTAGMEVTSVLGASGVELRSVLGPLNLIRPGTDAGAPMIRIDGLAPGEYRIGLAPAGTDAATNVVTAVVQANETVTVQGP